MKTRHLASKALLTTISGLLIATGPAAAGDYSPKHLRAESLLDKWSQVPRTVRYEFAEENGIVISASVAPVKLSFDYPFAFRQGAMLLTVEVRPKLRRIIQFKVRY